jgi:signal transduction histidine kinase
MAKDTVQLRDRGRKARGTGQYWRSVIDGLDYGLVIIDRDFRIDYVNAAVLSAYPSEGPKLVGKRCFEVFHSLTEPCSSSDCECPAMITWETGKPAQAVHVHGVEAGDERDHRYIEVKSSPLWNEHGDVAGAVLVYRDITEARGMEQRILEGTRNLLALNVIAEAVSQSLDLDTVLNSALDKVLELMRGDTGGILLLDEETQTLSYRVYRGLSEEFVRGMEGLRLGEGIAGTAARQAEPVCVDNISEDPRLTRWQVIREGLKAFASVPLVSKNRVLGVMNITSHTLRQFTPEDIQLLSAVSSQIAVAVENAKLYDELQRRQEMRGELLRLTISTQEEERRRIARGLHDETSQALTGLALNLGMVADLLPPNAVEAKAKLKEVLAVATRTLDEIHNVIYELRPTLLDDLGLIAALRWHVEDYLGAAGVEASLETAGRERRLPLEMEVGLFRVVQEATTNIVRHASAETACVGLDFGESSVIVTIEDDGQGFDPLLVARDKDPRRGLGLLGMRERVEHLGGALEMVSAPCEGTQIRIEVPMNPGGGGDV